MIRGLALAVVVLGTGGSSSAEVVREVAIPGKFFSPGREIVLIGETVAWRNGDSSSHTVTAVDQSFDSGTVAPGGSFERTFSSPGIFRYFCTIHRYMRGEVDVYGLALDAPGYAVPFGLTTSLKGLAPPGTPEVTIRRQDADGRFVDVGAAPVSTDGSFRFPLRAELPGVYLAAAGALTSAPVTLSVAARVRVAAREKRRRVTVTVRTEPAQPRARVELQAYALERFDFVPLRSGRLDARGRVVFRINVPHKLHLRVLLPTGARGFGRAVSPTLLIR